MSFSENVFVLDSKGNFNEVLLKRNRIIDEDDKIIRSNVVHPVSAEKPLFKRELIDEELNYSNGGQMLTLMSCCVAFLTQNVERIDSLSGIPEFIGREIFDRAKSGQKLTPGVILMFNRSYFEEFMPRLKLRDENLLNYRDESFAALLKNVVKLDIRCNFDFLLRIKTFPRLKTLKLSSNSNLIGPADLRTWLRDLRGSDLNLEYLDLSEIGDLNRELIDKLFKEMPTLKTVVVTEKDSFNEVVVKSGYSKMDGNASSAIEESHRFETEGWAEGLIHQWEREMRLKKEQKRKKDKKGFYAKKVTRLTKEPRVIMNKGPICAFVRNTQTLTIGDAQRAKRRKISYSHEEDLLLAYKL